MTSPNLNIQVEPTPDTTLEVTLEPLVTARQDVSAQITLLEGQKREVSDEIASAMLAAGTEKVQVGQYSLTFSAQERRTIDKAALKLALVERGVPTSVIEAAIGVSEKVSSFTKLDVRERKGK